MFKDMFNTFFSIRLMAIGDQAVAFASTVVIEVIKRLYALVLFILPYLFILRYKRNISYSRKFKLYEVLVLCCSLIFLVVGLNVNKEVKELVYNIDNNASDVEKLGVNVSTYLDLKRIFIPVKEEIVINNIDEVDEEDIAKYLLYKEGMFCIIEIKLKVDMFGFI